MEITDDSHSMNFQPLPEVIETVLFKKIESNFTRIFKKFVQRYFILDIGYRELSYKNRETDPKIRRIYKKDEVINYSPNLDKNEPLLNMFKYGFKIFTKKRTLLLFTNQKKDYDLWMRSCNYYFYGVDPAEEKEKLKLMSKKNQQKMFYPYYQFRFYKNISFTLSKRNESDNQLQIELLNFGDRKDNEKETKVEDGKEKAFLLDGTPLKQNRDLNRKKVNLAKIYTKKITVNAEYDKKLSRISHLPLENDRNNFTKSMSGINGISELGGFREITGIENVSNLNFHTPASNKSITVENSKLENFNTIEKYVEGVDFLIKQNEEKDKEMAREIDKKYKDFLEWPVENDEN
jgi:hypothetical protein